MRYNYPKPNEWIRPDRIGFRLGCCDCGLVHELDFRVIKRHIEFRVRSNKRATAAMRRGMKRKKK